MTIHKMSVVVSQDTRAFAAGNISHLPSGKVKRSKLRNQVITESLGTAIEYNRRSYGRTRVWRAQ